MLLWCKGEQHSQKGPTQVLDRQRAMGGGLHDSSRQQNAAAQRQQNQHAMTGHCAAQMRTRRLQEAIKVSACDTVLQAQTRLSIGKRRDACQR